MAVSDPSPEISQFQIWQCLDDGCRFRYPAAAGSPELSECPRCRRKASPAGAPFVGRASPTAVARRPSVDLEVLLDNVRSSHNVGSIFRSCDGAGVKHIHLCGITSTPRQGKVGKSALGAEGTVPWSYHRNAVDAVRLFKRKGSLVWALENREANLSIFDLRSKDLAEPLLVVVGNELAGVDPAITDLSDRVVSIPMMGHKSSLNAAVALGIVAYWLQYGIQRDASPS